MIILFIAFVVYLIMGNIVARMYEYYCCVTSLSKGSTSQWVVHFLENLFRIIVWPLLVSKLIKQIIKHREK